MSKRLKFKLKKTLKNAEFVHADLEYHEEMNAEAKKLFAEEISKQLDSLPPEEKSRLQKIMQDKAEKDLEHLRRQEAKRLNQEDEAEESLENSLVKTDYEPEEVCEGSEPNSNEVATSKTATLKKLFHRIAELTHPDKIKVNNVSDREASRLEKIFKKALHGYENDNWYILYSIALDLDIDIEDPSEEQVEWIEEDIRATLSAISQISGTIPWTWYVGSEQIRIVAIQAYFKQVYNYDFKVK